MIIYTVSIVDMSEYYTTENVISIHTSKRKAMKYVEQLKFSEYPGVEAVKVHEWDTETQKTVEIYKRHKE